MKKIGISVFVVALVIGLVVTNLFSFGGFSHNPFKFTVSFGGIHGSGNVKTEKRALDGFKGVEAGGVFQVEIVAQKDYSVEIEAEDNLLPLISTEIDDGVLKIKREKKLAPTKPILIRISAPDIESLDISGASSATLIGVKNDALTLDISGASKVKIAGETAKLTAEISGASKIDASDLQTVDSTIDSSGASTIEVNVSGELRTDASGASNIYYTGTPQNVVTSTSGASRVSRK